MTDTTPTFTQAEPVIVGDAVKSLLVAAIALAQLFDWVHWSPEQVGGVLLFYVALSGVVTVLVRSKTTPVPAVRDANKPYDRGDIGLIEVLLVAIAVGVGFVLAKLY